MNNIKQFFTIKHKLIALGVIGGLLAYGSISYTHAKNVQSYHPNIQLLSYRNHLQSSLNYLGNLDMDRAKIQYNHKNHHLIFKMEDYDSIRSFQKDIARKQTNYFKHHNHIKYVTYSIHVLPSAIKQHLIQEKENKEQIKENRILEKQQQIAEKKQAEKQHQQAIKKHQAQQAQIKREQQKKQHQQKQKQQKRNNSRHKSQNHHIYNNHKK